MLFNGTISCCWTNIIIEKCATKLKQLDEKKRALDNQKFTQIIKNFLEDRKNCEEDTLNFLLMRKNGFRDRDK